MAFTNSAALLFLLVLPIAAWLGWPRAAYRRSRDLASLLVRAVLLTLVILALAGAQAVQGANALAVVFVLDRSDSVGGASLDSQTAYVREAMADMPPDDLAAVVAFGGNALVERPMRAERAFSAVRSTPNTGNSDLEEALNLAMALFPADRAARIVVLSDGEQTLGDAAAAAQRAAATGVEISVVPLQRQRAPEVQVSAVRAPAAVNAGQTFDLGVTVTAELATAAELAISSAGELLLTTPLELETGENNYSFTLTAGEGGFADFQAQVTVLSSLPPSEANAAAEGEAADPFYQNNRLSAFSRVVGPPRVLLVASDPAESVYIAAALREQGLAVDERAPSSLPNDVATLEGYDSVVLADVPATDLSNQRQENLQTYVRDLGGGLVVVGGPESYAPGGYYQTVLEEILPVEMQIRDQQRLPQFTIAYVIDRSGSMEAVGASGVSNLELAKEAIIRSVDFLQPTDRAGVVSFDVDGYWVADVQPVRDRFALQSLVGTLRAGGGTDILAGYALAAEALAADPAQRKHIIVLTDGGADPGDLVELAGQLNADSGVTTSVISIGGGPDFLAAMAEAGGGNYHEVLVTENIPTIFTQEMVLALRSYIVENEFTPSIGANSPILDGITTAPALLGYVATSLRDTAQMPLVGPAPFNDPILAQWQYGLGRAVAFTSDATARWGTNWVTWDAFARFWAQTVRYTIIEGADDALETAVIMQGETARITVDARAPQEDYLGLDVEEGDFLNGLALSASVVSPDNTAVRVPLRQVAPGQYAAEYTPQGEGAYFVNISGTPDGTQAEGEAAPLSQTSGWVMSYSPEYAISENADGGALLREMAAATGGRDLTGDPSAVFAHTLSAAGISTPLAPVLLLIALLLLPLDIAIRRLLVTRSDLARVRGMFRRPETAREGASAARMESLRGAKARAQGRTTGDGMSVPPPAPAPLTPSAPPAPARTAAALREARTARATESAPPPSTPSSPLTPPAARPAMPVPPLPPAPPPTPEAPVSSSPPSRDSNDSLAGALLKRRRERD